MRKSAAIFLLAVLLPSAVLGWLALRNAAEQKIVFERRTAELYQKEVDGLAESARAIVDDQRRTFGGMVRKLVAGEDAGEVAADFSSRLAEVWPRKAVGFALDAGGRLVAPSPRAAEKKPEWQKFLFEQGAFLGGRITASVYTVPVDELVLPEVNRKLRSQQQQSLGREVPALALASDTPKPSPPREDQLRMKLAFPPVEKEEWKGEANDDAQAESAGEKSKAFAYTAKPMDEAAKAARTPVPAPAPPASRAVRSKDSQQRTRAATAAKSKVPARPASPQPRGVNDMAEPPTPAEPAAPATVQSQEFTDGIFAPNSSADAPRPMEAPVEAGLQKEALTLANREAMRRQEVQLQPLRNVQPQQARVVPDQTAWSSLLPETAEFRALTAGRDEGIVTRFVQDRLSLIFWLRPSQAPELIFGCLIDVADLADLWPATMPEPDRSSPTPAEFVLALLDDKARPVARSPENETGRDWKRPFVASEIGEALPHWEAALYLMRPEQLQESARGVRRTLTFLIAGMVGAIALGGWLVVADTRRQLALAQQKTDFVSNVSHELKTPLTSIRMFAELMLRGRGETSAKAPQYLRIIMVEAERLTRLINNVLDFATLERRQKRFDKKPLDLHEVIERTWEGHELHLREAGFETRWEAAAPPYPVIGDDDVLAQILVNLLSNAEKYSTGGRKEIGLHSWLEDGRVCVSVLDRGAGVPEGEEHKIFEAFYRAHDSLSSGIQGSGLGLTLARQLAREHGGEITCSPRTEGGSNFTLRLPLSNPPSDS